MPLHYRPARAEELAQAEALVVHSINDLTERHGFGSMASLRPPQFQLFCLNDDPDGLWTAADQGEMVGFALSWTCGDLWFLAELFVSPTHQGRGIGNELLKRTFAHAQKAGATTKALITFTFNTVSQGLYIRHGMFPRLPIYMCNVTRERLQELQGERFRFVPVESTTPHLAILAAIDASVLGVSREKHHRFLIDATSLRGVLLYAANECVGYAYISPDGHVGPLAVTRPDALGAAFRTALSLAVESGTPNVSAFLPGTAEASLQLAAAYGMRISFPMVLVSSREFGDWTRYLPRNPGFM